MDSSLPSFGELLRRHRIEADLTQEALAERAGLSARAISDLERGINKAPRRDTAKLLVAALGLEGATRATFLTASRAPSGAGDSGDRSGRAGGSRPASALPVPPSPMVDREREVALALRLLQTPLPRLVTLTGPGGVGKTRLAFAIATAAVDFFADGVWFVPLAEVREPDRVGPAIAQALGLRERSAEAAIDQLRAVLRGRSALLLLDNFEQVLDAAPVVADLLAIAPGVKALGTSRAALRIRGEREVPVEPLPVPPPGATGDLRTTGDVPAVQLFVERAVAVRDDFRLTRENVEHVVDICRRLDGLPLGIELAAAAVRLLTPAQLCERLAAGLDLPVDAPRDAPARQRTLRTTIAWSYGLLLPAQRDLLCWLAVCAGGCRLETVEAIGGQAHPELRTGAASVAALGALVDHHLVRRMESADGEVRYGQLETIRAFALERLEEAGAGTQAREAHAVHFLALAATAMPALTGAEQAAWLDRLEEEHDNFRAALRWWLANGDARAIRLAGTLWWFWWVRGHLTEGRSWLRQALALAAPVDPDARAQALTGAGTLAEAQGDFAAAIALHEEALSIWKGLGDTRGVSRAIENLAGIAADRGELARAEGLYRESLALCREIGDEQGAGHSLLNLGRLAWAAGKRDIAAALFDQSLAVLRRRGDTHGVAGALTGLGNLALYDADLDRAITDYDAALELWRELGNKEGMARVLANLGQAWRNAGDLDLAEALFRQAESLSRELGDKWGVAFVSSGLGQIALSRGEPVPAAGMLRQSLRGYLDLSDQEAIAGCLELLGAVAIALGDAARGVRLAAAGATLRERIGTPLPAIERPAVEGLHAAARGLLACDAYEEALAWGRTNPLEAAIAEALAFPVTDRPRDGNGPVGAPLTTDGGPAHTRP